MIKNISVNELLVSDLFVREPVDSLNDCITEKDASVVILASNRGSGRSVVLNSRQRQNVSTDNPAIYTRFDACGKFGKKDDDFFNSEFMKHYYEMVMAGKLLGYIKKHYPEQYSRHFEKMTLLVESRLYEVDRYIRDAYYKQIKLREKFQNREITSELLKKFRKTVGFSTVELMIDRFDWTHNSDPRVQSILASYFDLFDKAIITTDDSSVWTPERFSRLDDNGFEVIGVGYSQFDEVIREIVKRRIDLGREFDAGNHRFVYPIDTVRVDTFERMIGRVDGNINLILEAFIEAEDLYQWDSKNFDANKTVENACAARLEHNKQLRRMAAPQVLHL